MKDMISKSNVVDKSKQMLDTVKLFLRKSLEKFMSDVIIAKLVNIDKSVSSLKKGVDRMTIFNRNSQSMNFRRSQPKDDKQETNGIKTEGEVSLASSSVINLRKRSVTKVMIDSPELSLKVKTLEATMREKNNVILNL